MTNEVLGMSTALSSHDWSTATHVIGAPHGAH